MGTFKVIEIKSLISHMRALVMVHIFHAHHTQTILGTWETSTWMFAARQSELERPHKKLKCNIMVGTHVTIWPHLTDLTHLTSLLRPNLAVHF